MQTERIAAALRPRNGWEAVDLGFRMVGSWWRPLFGAWLLVVWPLAIAIHVVLVDHLLLAFVIVWWLKPLYDRIALYVLSEALFGHVPRTRDVLRELPRLLRTGLASSLTWQRLAPLRSVHLPVLQLEHLRGRVRAQRVRVLVGRESRIGVGLLLACLGFEWLVVSPGLIGLISLFQPEYAATSVWELVPLPGSLPFNAVYLLAFTIIQPFYVGGGFSLYINRRVYLEGWDIDLVFRKLGERLRPHDRRAGAAALATALAVALVSSTAPRAAEREPVVCEAGAEHAAACIDEVLASDEFGTSLEIEYWWPKGWNEEEAEELEPLEAGWLVDVARLLARVAQAVAWGVLAATLGVLAWILLRSRQRGDEELTGDRGQELALRRDRGPVALPHDLVGAARERWAAGDASGALSLLYRGALAHLVERLGLRLPPSATEGECDRLARRRAQADLAEDFSLLTRAWQYCAYAHEPPDDGVFHDLCRRWQPRLEAER